LIGLTASANRRWHRLGQDVLAEQFEQAIIFDPQTGETHFLSELPLMLLSAVNSKPQDIRELTAHLDPELDLNDGSRVKILEALYQLEQAGLVESESDETNGSSGNSLRGTVIQSLWAGRAKCPNLGVE